MNEFTSDDVCIPHAEAVRLRREGKLLLGITKSAADQISSSRDLKPTKTTAAAAFKFWIIVALLGFAYSIYLSFTSHWWWFLVGLIAAMMIIRANSGANQSNLLDAAMLDADFYEKIARLGGWLYRMNKEDAEPYFTNDHRLGQDALRRLQAGLGQPPD
jgi:hypothetical protein